MRNSRNAKRRKARSGRARKPQRSKIDGSPAEEAVKQCLKDGSTLREASGTFRDITGENISLDSVSRYARRFRQNTEELFQLESIVDKLVDQAGSPIGLDAAALARRLLVIRALEAVEQLPDGSMHELSAERLSMIISRLERSRSVADRTLYMGTKSYTHAREDILAELDEVMRGHPDLMEKNRIVVDQSHENALAKKEGRAPRRLDDELYKRNSPGPGQPPAEENPESGKI
jgi:hypothetical protein